MTGTTIGQILNAAATPALARIYSPDDFGTYGVFLAITSILMVIVCLRYEVAIILPDKDEDGASLLLSSLGFSIVVPALVAFATPFLGQPLISLFRSPELGPYLWMVPVTLVGMGFYLAFNYWNTRTKTFERLSISRIVLTVVTLVIQIGMGIWLGSNPALLNAGFAAGFVGASLVLAVLIFRDDRRLLKPAAEWPRITANLGRYKKFPLLDSWANLLYAISWQIPPLLIAVYFTKAQVGYYSLAYRLIQMPVALVGASVAQVLSQRSSVLRNDKETLIETTGSVYNRLLILGLFPSLLLTILGEVIFVFVFGSEWAEAGVYVQILAIWMFFWFTSYPLVNLASVFEHQEINLILSIVNLVTRFLALYAGYRYQNIYFGLLLFSISGSIIYLATILINLRIVSYPLIRALMEMLKVIAVDLILVSPLILAVYLGAQPLILFGIAFVLSMIYGWYCLKKGLLSF